MPAVQWAQPAAQPDGTVSPVTARSSGSSVRWQRAVRLASGAASASSDSGAPDWGTAPLSVIQQRTEPSEGAARPPPPPRLALMIHGAHGLPASGSGASTDLYVKAVLQRKAGPAAQQAPAARTPLARKAGSLAVWRSLLSLAPGELPASMRVKLKLKHRTLLTRAGVEWGAASIDLGDVLARPEAWGARQQLRLAGPRLGAGSGASLEVQLFLATEHMEGPLSVLVGTWNVGNATPPPPGQLGDWLRGADDSTHHLVVVGSQECNYQAQLRKVASAAGNLQGASNASGAAAGSSEQQQRGTNGAAGVAAAGAAAAAGEDVLLPLAAEGGSEAEPREASWLKQDLQQGSKRAAVKRYLLEQVDSAANWESHISAALGDKYWLVQARHMLQTRLLVFARVDVVPSLSHVWSGSEATGIGHVGLNKGGVAVALKLQDTHLAFVNSHLAAHQSKTAARNSNVVEIVSNLRPSPAALAAKGADVSTGVHHLVWCGDLNYRLAFGQQGDSEADSPSPEDHAALVALIEARAYNQLLPLDQLRREQAAGRVFAGFSEGRLDFAPTFKVAKGVAGCSYAAKRSPAWCDRVLFKSALPHKAASCAAYWACPDIASSDHKPVAALLALPLASATVTAAGGPALGGQRAPFKLFLAGVSLDAPTWLRLAELLQLQKAPRLMRLQLVLSGACLGGARQEHIIRLDPCEVKAQFAAALSSSSSSGRSRSSSSCKDAGDNSAVSSSGGGGGGRKHAAPHARRSHRRGLLLREEGIACLPGAAASLTDDFVLVRLVLLEGLGMQRRVLARGVLPLAEAVAAYLARSFSAVPVCVTLEAATAAVGRASLSCQLISSHTARLGMLEAIRRMRALASAGSGGSAGSSGSGGAAQPGAHAAASASAKTSEPQPRTGSAWLGRWHSS